MNFSFGRRHFVLLQNQENVHCHDNLYYVYKRKVNDFLLQILTVNVKIARDIRK